jgi:hypothetical protein
LALVALCAAQHASAASRLRVVSGSGQTAWAYAASTEPGYVTTFARPLVVGVSGRPLVANVRFRCVTRGCRFAASIQPDDVKRIDPQTYEVRVRSGTATLRPTLSTDAPERVAVDVRPVAGPGVARFTLTAR